SIVVVAEKPAGDLVAALTAAGAFPVIEANWSEVASAMSSIKPSAVILAEPESANPKALVALTQQVARAEPIVPVLARVAGDAIPLFSGALAVAADAPAARLVAQLTATLRTRALHATVLGRAKRLKSERNIAVELPDGDPLDDATVLVVGRGRSHPILCTAVGERVGVMGALSVDQAARCLGAREIDGVVIGEGLPARSVKAFIQIMSEDSRFRDMPVAMLGAGSDEPALPNFLRVREPRVLVERILPLVRMHALESRLKRFIRSIECKGMLDARTGLLTVEAFGSELSRAIDDSKERGVGLSVARFSFETEIDIRAGMDAARLLSGLIRNIDLGCRQDDGSIVVAFAETDLRAAHVVARRLASVLKHTMLGAGSEGSGLNPTVTLATLKPTDNVLTLMARIAPRPVAAE